MMDSNLIRIELEKIIGNELYNLVEGDILEEIIKESQIERFENDWKYLLEGHSFRVTTELAPSLYQLFHTVCERLQFDEPVEFYVTNSSEFNASAISSHRSDQPHIINLNSNLVERLDDEELMFVVGHEIGHLISKNTNITRLIQFVFPSPDRIPLIMQHKISLWRKLSELTADRYGYIASPSLEKCVSGFFKTSSGLDIKRINFRYESYLAENEKSLSYYLENNALNLSSHPINPLRLKAIEFFSRSRLFNDVVNNKQLTIDEELNTQINSLVSILQTLSNDKQDHYRKIFIVTAGIFMANVDQFINEDEYEKIMHNLAMFTIFPKSLLEKYLIEREDITKTMIEAVIKLIEFNPAERYPAIEYMISIALADNEISRNEINMIYDIGVNVLHFSRKEIAQILANNIQVQFMPDVYRFRN